MSNNGSLTSRIYGLSLRAINNMQANVYEPLLTGRIRLLKLKKARYEDELEDQISITLHTFHIHGPSLPSYMAISYTWDDPRPPLDSEDELAHLYRSGKYPIECDGGQISIRKNLFDALRRLRYFTDVEYLWVDGLCMNQEDLDERNSQVALMGDIYAKAGGLIVWLGEGDEQTQRAAPLVEMLGEALKDAWYPETSDAVFTRSPPFSDPTVFQKLNLQPFGEDDWRAIAHVFRHSWFSRAWTVQEGVLPPLKAILCGRKLISYAFYNDICSFLLKLDWVGSLREISGTSANDHFAPTLLVEAKRLRPTAPNQRSGFDRLLRSFYETSNGEIMNLSAAYAAIAVEHSRTRRATDPRDKVFALVSLAAQFDSVKRETLPLPDYSKSVEDIFVGFAKFLIIQTQKLSILSQVEASEGKRDENLPSWVPDFRIQARDPFDQFAFRNNFDIAGQLSKHESWFEDSNKLCIRGHKVATVSDICALPTIPDFDFNSLLELAKNTIYAQEGKEWLTILVHTLTALDTEISSTSEEALRISFNNYIGFCILASKHIRDYVDRKLTANSARDTIRKAEAAFGKLYHLVAGTSFFKESTTLSEILRFTMRVNGLLYYEADGNIGPDHPTRHQMVQRCEPFRSAMSRACAQRTFIATSNSSIGLGPPNCMVGDEIWLFPGANTSITVRPLSGTDSVLVGEVFLPAFSRKNGEKNTPIPTFPCDGIVKLI